MKIKVCGLREPENVAAIAQLPIDLMGFIFYPRSPRFAEKGKLKEWLERNGHLLNDIARVGVFVNAEIDRILNNVHDYQLDYVQLHGDESPGYCQELHTLWSVSSLQGAKLIKAFRVGEDFDFEQTQAYAPYCPLFLFDTLGEQAGGTGKQFDWNLLANYRGPIPFLLSGGIGPDDAEKVAAIRHPYLVGVDVNSKFEEAPGRKDVEQLRGFSEKLKSLSA